MNPKIIPSFALVLSVGLFGCSSNYPHPATDHGMAMPASDSTLDWAKTKLAKSPRHGEYVTVAYGNRAVLCWMVHPQIEHPTTAVLVIHDSSGLTDFGRLSADELAAEGYLAIAPDFLSGSGPNGGGTSSFANDNDEGLALKKLPPDQVIGDVNAAAEYVKARPSANGNWWWSVFAGAVPRPRSPPAPGRI